MKNRNRRGEGEDERVFVLENRQIKGLFIRDGYKDKTIIGYINTKDYRKTLEKPRDWKIVNVKS